jgi:hypothetical protein
MPPCPLVARVGNDGSSRGHLGTTPSFMPQRKQAGARGGSSSIVLWPTTHPSQSAQHLQMQNEIKV